MLIDTIVEKVPVEKGWSVDKKYRILCSDAVVRLLRISPREQLERRRRQHLRLLQAAALEIPMCRPLEFGVCEEGVYAIHSWISGRDAEDVIPTLPEQAQYTYGLDAGSILQRLHSLPAPEDAEAWAPRFNRKIDRKIAMYRQCPLKYENGEALLRHIAKSRHLLDHRPQTYQHGDYHIGNMMIDSSGRLTIIDFEKDDHGDPWEEFNRIVWCAQKAPAFARGMVDGYFDGQVPMEFWQLLALYICSNTLGSLPWAVPFGAQEIQTMRDQAKDVLSWYDNMNRVIPSWYTE